MGSAVAEYNSLKLRYYSLLGKKELEKGRIRALIGLYVWYYEQRMDNGGTE